jgi:hypothetical protein
MIPYLRIYTTSIINYIKYEVLPARFLEVVYDEPLVYNADLDAYVIQPEGTPSPNDSGRGWFPFDEATDGDRVVIDTSAEQVTRINVSGAAVYTVDYTNARIKSPNTVPTAVDYYWNYVSVIEGWPGSDPPNLPLVSVDVQTKQGFGFQLGGGSKDILVGSIHIFATSEAEKADITDAIHNAIETRTLPISNWHEGGYIKFDGTFNSTYTPTTISGVSNGYFTNVVSRLDGPRIEWSEINRHRSRITFEFEVYRD